VLPESKEDCGTGDEIDFIAGVIVAERRMILAGPFKVRNKPRSQIVVATATTENEAVNLILPI